MSLVLTVISLGTRVALAYALSAVPAIGVVGIWWSIPIGWALADLTGVLVWAARRAKVDRKFTPRRENALKSPVWCDMIGASFGKRETLWIWNTTKTKNWK